MKKRLVKLFLTVTSAALLSACTIGPRYQRPAAPVPANYKELGAWHPAHPADLARGPWWTVYNDPVLNSLEAQVLISNQTLKAAEAAYRQAAATVEEARAGLFPTVNLDASAERSKSRAGGVANAYNVSADASWAPDIWGRIRQEVSVQKATAQASAADLAAATLSTQATLAIDYFELRAADQQKRLLDETVIADKKSLRIATNQYKAGVVSKADVAQAQNQVDAVSAQALNVGIQRAALEHAIAVLIGKPPANFALKMAGDLKEAPFAPPGVPSALLERQPDIAAAERRVAAANANIGVAETAWFPDLTLTGSEGFASAVLGRLLTASSNVWAFGPQLAFTLFDGGLRSAKLKEAKAAFDQEVALYRQTVLTSFQQVEDDIASLRILAQQEKVEQKAVQSAREAHRLILNQYYAGTVAYTSVVTAQTEELSDRQAALNVRLNRLVSSVQLIEALGGGWDGDLSGNLLNAAPALVRTHGLPAK